MPRSPRPRRPAVTATAHQPTTTGTAGTTGQPLPPLLQWPAAADAQQPHHQHQPQPVAPLALHTSSTAQPHQLHPLPPAPPLSAYQHQPHQPQQPHHQLPPHLVQPLPQPVESGHRLACFDRRSDDGRTTQLRVNWATFNGHPYLSLRVWALLDDGRWVPDSRRGCTVKLRELEEFRDAVQQALDIVAHDLGV
jgi:hypothetical protein